MTGILMAVVLTAAASIVTLVVLYAVATRPEPIPGVVDPFHPGVGSDPSADTLPTGGAMAQTSPPTDADWQVATLTNLSDVEDFLDCLEARGCADREVLALGDSSFAVRWR